MIPFATPPLTRIDSPLPTHDLYAGDDHRGSSDLERWPVSTVEASLAAGLIDGDGDVYLFDLWDVSKSIGRVQKVLDEVRRRRRADALLERIT